MSERVEQNQQPALCPACEEARSQGRPDIFCSACALRRALALGAGSKIHNEPREMSQSLQRTSRMKTAPEIGEIIEDYEILEKIGGNMGLVFKARHRLLQKIVAIKLLPADRIADATRLARFEREMRAMGQLSHPNLVTAADARNVQQWRLVVMEWIDGPDLQQITRTHGPLPVALACEVIRQAAIALDYAHKHGLTHRDIKPSNLMMTRSGDIKLIDLGLAGARDDASTQITQPGLAVGTMTYCAPEQFRDAASVDGRADIYSLGCTFFQLLAGEPAFCEKRTLPELVNAHLNAPAPLICELRPDVPQEVENILARMMEKDPPARYQTAGEVAIELEPHSDGANLNRLLVPTTRAEPARRIAAGPQFEPPRSTGGMGTSRARRWAAIAAAILIVAALAVAFMMMQSGPVVVLMDTTAPGGVYESDTRLRGGTNAEDLGKVLHDLVPNGIRQEAISSTWEAEAQVLGMQPSLVVLHRSMFFHSLNTEFNFPTNDVRWPTLYRVADERVKSFIGLIGTTESKTKFLIYSRGTDPNWLTLSFREQWRKELEDRFPKLKGRIETMVIPGGVQGSFRNPETANAMRKTVAELLNIPVPRE